MSAKLDRSQNIQFYFGNAARDFERFLPTEDMADDFSIEVIAEVNTATGNTSADTAGAATNDSKLEAQMGAIDSLLAQSLTHIEAIKDNRRQLTFLLQDIKRMLG